MQGDWSDLIAAFAAGAFPWISEFKRLPIHFEIPGLQISAIFNFFGSLFALAVYGYCVYAHPTQVVDLLPAWYWLLIFAFVLTVLFFSLFLFFRTQVKDEKRRGVVIVSFVAYVGLFASLTGGFGSLKLLNDYVVVSGTVVDSVNTGIAGVDIEITDTRSYRRAAKTDTRGRFNLLIEKDSASRITQAKVTKSGRQDVQITLASGFSAPSMLRRVILPR